MALEYVLDNLEERDADFAIIQSFVDYEKVRELFFKQIKRGGSILKIYHSLTQNESDGHKGESDIVIILKDSKGKYAIFIENKIAADPQPKQRERYDDRAKLLAKQEQFTEYYVFLCAPDEYLVSAKADKYELSVSHNEICQLINTNEINRSVLNYSSNRKQGYVCDKNEQIVDFWSKLYCHIKEHFPDLVFNKPNDLKGNRSAWFTFLTCVKKLYIVWKTDRETIDMEFTGMAKNSEVVVDLLKQLNATNYALEVPKGAKSVLLHLNYSSKYAVSPRKDFNSQIDNINYCLSRVLLLNELAKKIRYMGISSIPFSISFSTKEEKITFIENEFL